MGFPKVHTYPTVARFKFRDGRGGEVRYAADIKVDIAGRGGTFTACVSVADIPAMLRKGVPEALEGQLDFGRDFLAIRGHGVDVLVKVDDMGHYVLRLVALGRGPSGVDGGPNMAAVCSMCAFADTT